MTSAKESKVGAEGRGRGKEHSCRRRGTWRTEQKATGDEPNTAILEQTFSTGKKKMGKEKKEL